MLNITVGHHVATMLYEAGMPLEKCNPDTLQIEVSESFNRKEYRQPFIWEALDWLQSVHDICVYNYPMTQWRKLAIRRNNNGTLISDIKVGQMDETDAWRLGITEALKHLKDNRR